MPTDYRADIDGLRAVSATAVVLFHVEAPGFSGGFVGVDIFFVISGYLITQVLLVPGEKSTLRSLRDFYLRRCRRILPALLVLLLVTSVLAPAVLSPMELGRYGRYVAYTSVFLTNLAAWRDLSGAMTPLIHLWTIAVEEQFYLAYPLFLLLVLRNWKTRIDLVLSVLASLSFVLSVWASHHAPTANVYLPATRAWELLLGAIIARRPLAIETKWIRELLSMAALIGILACFIGFSLPMRYPGLSALAPCAAAGALMATGARSGTFVSRWLSVPPLVFTGLISYSLYLWHLPIITLIEYRYYGLTAPAPPLKMGLVVVCYLVAVASWRLVEQPFRNRTYMASDKRFLGAALLVNAAIGVVGALMYAYSRG